MVDWGNHVISLELYEEEPGMDVHQLLEAIFESSADGIIAIDQDYTILGFNPAMEKLVCRDRDEVIGARCCEILKPKDNQSSEICRDRCPLSSDMKESGNLRCTIAAGNGSFVDVDINYSPSQLQDGRTILVVNVREITSLTEIEDLRSSLLSKVSHELQTPIAIIKAYASTLARPDVRWTQETIKEKLGAIEGESDRLSAIIAKMLFTSRLEAGAVKLNKFVLDLSKEARRIAKRFANITDKHSLEIDFPVEFPFVLADPERIEEVLSNLIENAIKFSPNGGRIVITGNISDNNVLVSVADNGIGIRTEEGEKLFERFYRAEDSAVKSTNGTGLGLYICRLLIEAHGGKISVEGSPGNGACFTFTLPRLGELRESVEEK